MRYRLKHQYVWSIKGSFPKCFPCLSVSSWASRWAQTVGSFEERAAGPEGARIEKGKASCGFLRSGSHLVVGASGGRGEVFARIKCGSVHKKMGLLKEKSNYGNTELSYRRVLSSYRKQPTNKVTKNRQLYAEQPKTSWFINIWRNFIVQTQPNCTFYNHILFVNS